MRAPNTERLLDAIARATASLPEAQAAFLFGSHAVGRTRADSDVDVAMLLDDSIAPPNAGARLRRVLEAFAAHIAADRLDVAILNDVPPALAFQVLKYGQPAFERGRSALHRFRVDTYARHSDFEPVERFSVKQRVAELWAAAAVVDAGVRAVVSTRCSSI